MTPTLPEFTIPTPDDDPVIGPLNEMLRTATARHRALPDLVHEAFLSSLNLALDLRERALRGGGVSIEEEQGLREAAHRADMLRAELAGARKHLEVQGRLIREATRRRFDEHLEAAAAACDALDDAADAAPENLATYDTVAHAMMMIVDQLRVWSWAAGYAGQIPKFRTRIPDPRQGASITATDIARRLAARRARLLTAAIGGV